MEGRAELKISEIENLEAGKRIRTVCQLIKIDENGIGEGRDITSSISLIFQRDFDCKTGDYLLINGRIIGEGKKAISVESYKKISVEEFNFFEKWIDLKNKLLNLVK